jgi:hypothetical protein
MRDGWALLHRPASALLRRPLLLSGRFDNFPVYFIVVSYSPFGPSWRFSQLSAWSIFRFPAPIIFCLPSVGAVDLEVARLSTTPACYFLASLRRVGGDRLPQKVLMLVLCRLAAWRTACSSRACRSASITDLFPPSSSWILMSWSSTPSANALPASCLMCFSGSVV